MSSQISTNTKPIIKLLSNQHIPSPLTQDGMSSDIGKLVKHLQLAFAYPDEGSEFGKHLGQKKYLFREKDGYTHVPAFLKKYFFSHNYDALTLHEPRTSDVMGHIAWQDHSDERHIFSVYVTNEHRQNGYGLLLNECALATAQGDSRIRKLQLGIGGHIFMNKIYANFVSRSTELGVEPTDKNLLLKIKN